MSFLETVMGVASGVEYITGPPPTLDEVVEQAVEQAVEEVAIDTLAKAMKKSDSKDGAGARTTRVGRGVARRDQHAGTPTMDKEDIPAEKATETPQWVQKFRLMAVSVCVLCAFWLAYSPSDEASDSIRYMLQHHWLPILLPLLFVFSYDILYRCGFVRKEVCLCPGMTFLGVSGCCFLFLPLLAWLTVGLKAGEDLLDRDELEAVEAVEAVPALEKVLENAAESFWQLAVLVVFLLNFWVRASTDVTGNCTLFSGALIFCWVGLYCLGLRTYDPSVTAFLDNHRA